MDINKRGIIPYELQKLEEEPMTTTNGNNEYSEADNIPFNYTFEYLYHGIRFQKYLEKLESIFQEKKILAGKYIKNYHLYSDNCNKGEYVSLFKQLRDTKLEYETFIESNISLLVTPLCNAIETKYVPFNTWLMIQKENFQLKNIYSYMQGECMCKDYIPLDMVRAIGVPYQRLRFQESSEYADKLLEDIKILMQKYDIDLPIVDTSRYNRILVESNKNSRGGNNAKRSKTLHR